MNKLNVAMFGAALAENKRQHWSDVKTSKGEPGKVNNSEAVVLGKVMVYLDNGEKKLCKRKSITFLN